MKTYTENINGKSAKCIDFSDIDEVLGFATQWADKPIMPSDEYFDSYGQEWHLELKEYIKKGHDEAINKLVEQFLASKSSLLIAVNEQTLHFDTSGDFVDIGRYMSGEPDCMCEFRQDQPITFLDVEVRIGRPSFTKPIDVASYFSLVANVIDEIENNGIRCRIKVAFCFCKKTEENLGRFNVIFKDYNEVFDYKKMATMMLYEEFFRAIVNVCYFQNLLQPQKAVCHDAFASVRTSIVENQSKYQITFPSMYFDINWAFGRLPNVEDFKRQIGIDFLFINQ